MKYIIVLLMVLQTFDMYSQESGEDQLNKLLNPAIQVSESKKSITLEFVKNGEVFRSDEFLKEEIEVEKISFDVANKNVVLYCFEYARPCIDRKITKTKSRRPYPTLNLPVENEQIAEQVIVVLREALSKEKKKK